VTQHKQTQKGNTNNMEKALTPKVQRALRTIHALRNLPETSGTIAAERRILNGLNSYETETVALELAEDDAIADGVFDIPASQVGQ
jgi:hypothetical protein